MDLALSKPVERRKQVRLRLRADLDIKPQKYEGRTHHVVKDPVSLRYYRFNDQEHFVVSLFDGKHTMEEIQKEFEARYRPQRLTHEDLEGFARQLLTAGLVQHESARAAEELLESRRKQRRMQQLATWTNILYIKIPVIDPDRLLNWMLKGTKWIFTRWFFALSVTLMLSALALVVTHFDTFYEKLPYYHEFFAFQTVLYMWLSLGVVKVIHEFGHGLSCKAFGGECHEMGFLLMCFSPAMYCNVSDSWTLPNKWKRIIISFAGIYVELIIASIATFVWWYTPGRPFINNLSLCLMTLCSVSTVVFNANPLMRFDGYYMLADWLEIPNLRDRANRYLTSLFKEHCLGMEVQPEPYMVTSRKILFISYAIVSYIYRWVVTFSIIYTLSNFLKPYKLGALSNLLAIAALGSLVGWPAYRMIKAYFQRGRLPDMKRNRVTITAIVIGIIVLAFLLLPLPISRVHEKGLIRLAPTDFESVPLPRVGSAQLVKISVAEGDHVEKGQEIAVFRSPELEDAHVQSGNEKRKHLALAERLKQQAQRISDRAQRVSADAQMQQELGLAQMAASRELDLQAQLHTLTVVAPRAGYVMSLPKREEIGKFWGESETRPVCQVGNTRKLQVVIPVIPADHELLQRDLASLGPAAELPVSIRVPGHGMRTFKGRLTELPTSEAKNVPVQLTYKGGGTLATRPGSNPNVHEPQSQVYLVVMDLLDADDSIQPGQLPTAKIHCRWRSGAWWTWRAINLAIDLH
jgi:putative peptide zinc metalloprotease protein